MTYDEKSAAASGLLFEEGWKMMQWFVGQASGDKSHAS
jgi:hypothetical protein